MQEPSARLYDILVYHARKFRHHDAAVEPEDLVQTAFVRGWAVVEGKPERDQLAYLSTVVTNLALDRLRQERRRRVESLEVCHERGQAFPSAERLEEGCLDRLALDDALARHNRPGLREVLLDAIGYTHREQAEAEGVDRVTISTRIWRFRHPRVVVARPPRPPLPPARVPKQSQPQAKLTPDSVRAIRVSTDSFTTLAARYGVSRQRIFDVRHRRAWRHIDPEE